MLTFDTLAPNLDPSAARRQALRFDRQVFANQFGRFLDGVLAAREPGSRSRAA
jgi:hypothetical protein